MKMKMLLAGFLVMAMASVAAAAGPYVGVSGGVSMIHDGDVTVAGIGSAKASYDTGYNVNLSSGYNFDGFRLEGEFGYKGADLDQLSGNGGSVKVSDTDITLLTFMANGYYDIKTGGPVVPFLGAGIGIINGEIQSQGESDEDTVFGYQLTAGVSYAVNKNLNLDVAYRFQGAGSDFSKNGVSFEYNSSNILAGVRYNF